MIIPPPLGLVDAAASARNLPIAAVPDARVEVAA
jgi:hypothetical protein